jgi:DNA repair protein RadC
MAVADTTRRGEALVARAKQYLHRQLREPGTILNNPGVAGDYFALHLARNDVEVFCAAWLDAQGALIAFEELSRGTLTQTTVHPREVVRAALRHNAAAVIFTHNHPSGVAEPSEADQRLTRNLRDALELVDVRVFDHVVIGGAQRVSFAQRGLL